MKISKLLLATLLISFAFVSCSKDDEVKNQAPNNFNLLEVANGSQNVEVTPTFSWSAPTSPNGIPVTYDLYVGTSNPPTTKVGSNLNNTINDLSDDLEFSTVYNWKVVAKNDQDSTVSEIFSFKTRAQTNQELLLGKWFIESIHSEPALTVCRKNGFYLFSNDSNFVVKVYRADSNGVCQGTSSASSIYQLIGNNKIEISNGTNTQVWKIQSLNQTELELLHGNIVYTFKKE